MTGLEIWLLAIGLAMDCFAVSIASGIILKRTRWKPMLVMAFAFGFFQAIMPFIGWMCAKTFSHLIESVDHWIAFAILAFLGGRMILESFKEEECCKLFNPANPKVVLTMAIARVLMHWQSAFPLPFWEFRIIPKSSLLSALSDLFHLSCHSSV